MIQRIQTLFFLGSCTVALVLLMIPSAHYQDLSVYLTQMDDAQDNLNTTLHHSLALLLNFLNLVVSFLLILLYQKRVLQRRLALGSAVVWMALAGCILFLPLVEVQNRADYQVGYWAIGLSALGAVFQWLAAQYIQKDIDLLKQADRIR